jgi:DNA-directed RNA polymerase specialized sigma24 family protein
VFRIARNAITDHYRRTARRRDDLDGDTVDDLAGSESADGWLEEQAVVLADLADFQLRAGGCGCNPGCSTD